MNSKCTVAYRLSQKPYRYPFTLLRRKIHVSPSLFQLDFCNVKRTILGFFQFHTDATPYPPQCPPLRKKTVDPVLVPPLNYPYSELKKLFEKVIKLSLEKQYGSVYSKAKPNVVLSTLDTINGYLRSDPKVLEEYLKEKHIVVEGCNLSKWKVIPKVASVERPVKMLVRPISTVSPETTLAFSDFSAFELCRDVFSYAGAIVLVSPPHRSIPDVDYDFFEVSVPDVRDLPVQLRTVFGELVSLRQLLLTALSKGITDLLACSDSIDGVNFVNGVAYPPSPLFDLVQEIIVLKERRFSSCELRFFRGLNKVADRIAYIHAKNGIVAKRGWRAGEIMQKDALITTPQIMCRVKRV